jgi:hypothetical protein
VHLSLRINCRLLDLFSNLLFLILNVLNILSKYNIVIFILYFSFVKD